jgi:hypothetical protein
MTDPQGRVGSQGLSLLDEYCVDPGQVFATGVSNGAGMSSTLGGASSATGSRPSHPWRA